jgi:D-ribose pyranose/furanose isomerase RbsD
MRTCEQHDDAIVVYDQYVPCPVCQELADLRAAKLEAEQALAVAKAELEAEQEYSGEVKTQLEALKAQGKGD